MQVVGKIQVVAPGKAADLPKVMAALERWADGKFSTSEDGAAIIQRSGATAMTDRRDDQVGDQRCAGFDVLEPVRTGELLTAARVLATETDLHFNCTLSLGVEGGLAPPSVDLFTPRFVREIIDLDIDWRASMEGEHLLSTFARIADADVEMFLALLQSPQRRLPLILVSELDGKTLAGDLHSRLASDVCGLAHVCRIDQAAAWAVTQRLDREWSCYNGAVRLFWPFRGNQERPRNHPLWTRDRLTARGDDEVEARDRLRQDLRRRLLDASTFVADDQAFRRFARLRDAPAVRSAETASSEDLVVRIAQLEATLEARDAEISTLNDNLAALNVALRSQSTADEPAGEEPPPATILEALAIARRRWGGSILFGDAVDDQAAALSAEAGPPEKVLRYLDVLAELAATRAAGALGGTVPTWLKERGVNASIESETIRNSRDTMKRRTFPIDAQPTPFELHAKPNDGVSPDQCVRIYFDVQETAPHVRIGYIGRHFE